MKKLYSSTLNYPFVYLTLSFATGLFLMFISSLPHSAIERSHYPQISDLFDAANHFAGFVLFNFMLFSAYSGFRLRIWDLTSNKALTLKRALLFTIPIGGGWGALCEVIQIFIPDRSFQAIDLAVNLLPAFIVPFVIIKISGEKSLNRP